MPETATTRYDRLRHHSTTRDLSSTLTASRAADEGFGGFVLIRIPVPTRDDEGDVVREADR